MLHGDVCQEGKNHLEAAAPTNIRYDLSNEEAEAGDCQYVVSLDYIHKILSRTLWAVD